MSVEFKKEGKGHDVFLNGNWVMHVMGSVKNAKKELKKDYNIIA